jgi:ABC-2 type transport system permease protein
MQLRLYWEVARRAFRRYATYRGATIAGVFTNTVFGFIRAYVMIALYRHRSDVGGFDLTDALTFVFVSQGFLMLTEAFGTDAIALRVRSGDIVTDLYRPLNFHAYWLAQDAGRAAFHAIARGLPPVVAGALVFDFRFATSPVILVAFVLSVVLAVVVSFGIRFLVNLSAFWLLDIRGPLQLVTAAQLFFAGLLVPITFFPPWLESVARVLPFAGILQIPIEILLGKATGTDLAVALLLQAFWAAALFGAGQLVVNAATRKMVVQGG